jgi:regulator of sigma E protease
MLLTILIFAATIVVLVGFHEAGHFLAAKAFGVYVHEFAIGFGPQLLSVRGKETRYSIRAIPLGGYVRMAGEDRREEGSEIAADRRLYSKPPLVRAAISLAGPTMNLLLSLVVTVAVVWAYSFPVVQVAALVPGGPASEVFLPGDRVKSIDGLDIFLQDQVTGAIQASEGGDVAFDVVRGGEATTVTVRPEYVDEEGRYVVGAYFNVIAYTNELRGLDPISTLGRAGLRDGDLVEEVNGSPTPTAIDVWRELEALPASASLTARRGAETLDVWVPSASDLADELGASMPFVDLGFETHRAGFSEGIVLGAGQFAEYVTALGDMVAGIVSGRVAAGEALVGPIGIAQELGEGIRLGPAVFFALLGFLSLNFGLLNLVPFPGLDGSRIVFAVYERIRGRPIPVEREGLIHLIGFVVLIALMILVTYKDLASLFR